jgi:hypothetical protein
MGHIVARIRVRPSTTPDMSVVVLRALVRKLFAYEPGIIDVIHRFTTCPGLDGQHRVSDNVFALFTKLTEVELPRAIVEIGRDAFTGCTRLAKVSLLSNALTHIGDRAFYDCARLRELSLSESLAHIGDRAFMNCSSFAGSSVYGDGDSSGDSGGSGGGGVGKGDGRGDAVGGGGGDDRRTLVLPDSLKHIGVYAFAECNRLKHVRLPRSLVHLNEGVFFECTALEFVTLPDTLTRILDRAFSGCSRLKATTHPRGLVHIGSSAFWCCESFGADEVAWYLRRARVADDAFVGAIYVRLHD